MHLWLFTVYWYTVVGCMVDIIMPLSGQPYLNSGKHHVLSCVASCLLAYAKCSVKTHWLGCILANLNSKLDLMICCMHPKFVRNIFVWSSKFQIERSITFLWEKWKTMYAWLNKRCVYFWNRRATTGPRLHASATVDWMFLESWQITSSILVW